MDASSFDTAISNIGADIARRAITEAIHIVEVAFGGAVERACGGITPVKPKPSQAAQVRRRGRGKSRPDVRAAITEVLKANPNASDAEVMAVAPSVNRSTIARARRSLGILRRTGGGRVVNPANADRRQRIGAAMAANPAASNKAIAVMLGIEHCKAFENDATRVRRAIGLPHRPRGGTRWEPAPIAPPAMVEIEIPGVRPTDTQDLTGYHLARQMADARANVLRAAEEMGR